jgi:hypothetical protein
MSNPDRKGHYTNGDERSSQPLSEEDVKRVLSIRSSVQLLRANINDVEIMQKLLAVDNITSKLADGYRALNHEQRHTINYALNYFQKPPIPE